jgi:phage repressor protein C with HTH and peptisase S24 domain
VGSGCGDYSLLLGNFAFEVLAKKAEPFRYGRLQRLELSLVVEIDRLGPNVVTDAKGLPLARIHGRVPYVSLGNKCSIQEPEVKHNLYHLWQNFESPLVSSEARCCSDAMALTGNKIKERRAKLGWSQAKLASESGGSLTRVTIARIETGEVKDPHETTLQMIEAALDRGTKQARKNQHAPTPHDIDPSKYTPFEAGHTIPVRTKVRAGPPMDYQEGIFADRFLPFALGPRAEWRPSGFVIEGDSMAPYFKPGDIVIVGSALHRVRTGDIVVVGFTTGDHTVKKVRVIDENTWELIPVNPDHERETVTRDRIAWFAPVLGRWEPIWTRRETPWDEDA